MNWQSMAGVTSGWTGRDWAARPDDSARVDPYLVWADATAFDDLSRRGTLNPFQCALTKTPQITPFDSALMHLYQNEGL